MVEGGLCDDMRRNRFLKLPLEETLVGDTDQSPCSVKGLGPGFRV